MKPGVDSYLLGRGFQKTAIDRFLTISKKSDVAGKSFETSGFEYGIDHFLDSSGKAGYDIEQINHALGIDGGALVAIALAEGDDPICIDVESGNVILWLLEDGERIQLARPHDEFASMIISVGK